MSTGISIHIGLNHVDPSAYNGWDGALSGCINDTTDMQRIADGLGYQSLRLIDSEATSARVVQEIGLAAQRLTLGDILLLTYSGHGGQTPDVNGDEEDGQDETWVLWDRQLVDDELYALWSRFAPGVRIVILSDSCHSGTVLRMMQTYNALVRDLARTRDEPSAGTLALLKGLEDALHLTSARALPSSRPESVRTVPPDVLETVNARYAAELATVQWVAGPAERAPVLASVLLISGCMDSQVSLDGAANGLFTEKVKQVWADGRFSGDYRSFHAAIAARMPASQTPNFATAGLPNPLFEAQRPFTLSALATGPVIVPRPTVRIGDSGPNVLYLQQRLSQRGYILSVDGMFGPGTQTAVIQFQRGQGLTADGVVGPMTWQALEQRDSMPETPASASSRPTLTRGSQGPDVLYLQQRLQTRGFRLRVDGDFAPPTESAVRSFQNANSLPPDGVVGPGTWAALG
ncbi:MAG: peptidoglycan-binding protein [Cystobacter sp.]